VKYDIRPALLESPNDRFAGPIIDMNFGMLKFFGVGFLCTSKNMHLMTLLPERFGKMLSDKTCCTGD
jgi:hypothetical protein